MLGAVTVNGLFHLRRAAESACTVSETIEEPEYFFIYWYSVLTIITKALLKTCTSLERAVLTRSWNLSLLILDTNETSIF
jgi:hypothetical protein